MNTIDLQSHLRNQEVRLNSAMNKMGLQSKITRLADDPIAAGHLVRYQSYLGRVETFEENARKLNDTFSVTEGYLAANLDILHRVRELSVQAATGTFTSDDLKNMAFETDELLQEMLQNANAIGQDNANLFGGTRTAGEVFTSTLGRVENAPEPLVTDVRYNGNVGTNAVEVDERERVAYNFAGSRVFWAEPQRLFAARDGTPFQVGTDSTIQVDGVDIRLLPGDNMYVIAEKINQSGAAVKASVDPATQGLNMETTDSHQLWLQDVTGTALFDLGLVQDAAQKPPYNIAPTAQVSGGSLFDAVMALRDAMLTGDQRAIGGKHLGALDQGFDNLTRRLGEIGAATERLTANAKRSNLTAMNVGMQLAHEGDQDITQAVTDMKMLEFVHQATLSATAKLYNTSLLNYLR
jgi:flagellar hook-associated protein 3 FlgL